MQSPLHHSVTIRRAVKLAADLGMPTNARSVLTALMLHGDERGKARITRVALEEFTGLQETSVKRALRQLRQVGLVGYGQRGRGWTINLEPPTITDAFALMASDQSDRFGAATATTGD